MKNEKEIEAILSAIYCINLSRGEKRDKDIEKIIEYSFGRLYNKNTNWLAIGCTGKNKRQVMPEVMQILKQDTQYPAYAEKLKKEIKNK